MLRVLALVTILGAAALAVWLNDSETQQRSPAPEIRAASTPESTGPLARGLERSRAVITVRRGDLEYELRGGIDLTEGYRFRGRVTESSTRYPDEGTPIWLAGGRGAWGGSDRPDTLTKPDFPFNRDDPIWFDDHPPTLPLTEAQPNAYDPDFREGAEVYAHLSLLALKHAHYGRAFDFTPYAHRNDLTKVVSDARRQTAFNASVGPAGMLERLRFALPPAVVDVRLSPSDRSIPVLKLRRFAIE